MWIAIFHKTVLSVLMVLVWLCFYLGKADGHGDTPEKTVVFVQGLDKTTGKTTLLTVPLDQIVTFGSLKLRVDKAVKSQPEERPEVYVYVTIWDSSLPSGREIFSGWMFASSPALSALDHPLYDIWVVDSAVEKRN